MIFLLVQYLIRALNWTKINSRTFKFCNLKAFLAAQFNIDELWWVYSLVIDLSRSLCELCFSHSSFCKHGCDLKLFETRCYLKCPRLRMFWFNSYRFEIQKTLPQRNLWLLASPSLFERLVHLQATFSFSWSLGRGSRLGRSTKIGRVWDWSLFQGSVDRLIQRLFSYFSHQI